MVFEGRFLKTEYQLSVFNRDALKMPKMLKRDIAARLEFRAKYWRLTIAERGFQSFQ